MDTDTSPHIFSQPYFPTIIFIYLTPFPGTHFPIHSFCPFPGPRFPKSQPNYVVLAVSPITAANTHYFASPNDPSINLTYNTHRLSGLVPIHRSLPPILS